MREQVVRMRQNGARIANMSLSLLSSISLTFLIFNLRHAKRRVVSSAGRGTYNGGRGKKRVPSPLSSIHRRSRVSFEVKSEDPRSPSANPTRRSRALYSSVGIRVSRLARGSYLTTRQRFLTERKYLAFEDSFLPFIFSFFPPSSNSIRRLIFRALENFLLFFVPGVDSIFRLFSMMKVSLCKHIGFFRKIATNFFQNIDRKTM